MLQQTQVSRVQQKYPLFIKSFPSFQHLAKARPSDVIRTWRGMGYNNRAIRLHGLAKQIINKRGGRLPESVAELMNLPGIGRYTAHAVACFAFHQKVPVVDTNIARILIRLFPGQIRSGVGGKKNQTKLWDLAEQALPRHRAYDWNQALMDLGSTICTAANPKCVLCPARSQCPSAFRVRRTKNRIAKREPGRGGISNRIYRGRIVEVLRNLNGRGAISSVRLGKLIKGDYAASDEAWLRLLLKGLQKDGLLEINKSKSTLTVSLPR